MSDYRVSKLVASGLSQQSAEALVKNGLNTEAGKAVVSAVDTLCLKAFTDLMNQTEPELVVLHHLRLKEALALRSNFVVSPLMAEFLSK